MSNFWKITWYGEFSERPQKRYATKLRALQEFNSFSGGIELDWDQTETRANVVYYQTIVAVLEIVDTDKLIQENASQWLSALSAIRELLRNDNGSPDEILRIVDNALRDFP